MRPVYLGIDNKAIQNTELYIGVDNIAKKVSRMYVGDESGTARLCYSAEQFLSDEHSLVDLTDNIPYRTLGTVSKFNDKIVLSGGKDSNDIYSDIYVLNSGLTVTNYSDALSKKLYNHEACNIADKYIAFIGGQDYRDDYSYDMQVFDKSMTKVQQTTLNCSIKESSSGSVGNYGLLFSGMIKFSNSADDYSLSHYLLSISDSLTLQFHNATYSRSKAGCACDKNHAIFACGNFDILEKYECGYVEAYDSSLTHTELPEMSKSMYIKGTSFQGYYLFGSPTYKSGGNSSFVDVYDRSLTKQSDIYLSNSKQGVTVFSTDDEAIFAGGYSAGDNFNTYYHKDMDIFDKSLTRSTKKLTSEESDNKLIGAKLKNNVVLLYSDFSNRSCEVIKLK